VVSKSLAAMKDIIDFFGPTFLEPEGPLELVEICKLVLEGKALCQCPDSGDDSEEEE